MVDLQCLKSKVSESLLRQISFQVEKAPRQKKGLTLVKGYSFGKQKSKNLNLYRWAAEKENKEYPGNLAFLALKVKYMSMIDE